jgi:hypothetical protein
VTYLNKRRADWLYGVRQFSLGKCGPQPKPYGQRYADDTGECAKDANGANKWMLLAEP